MSGVPLRRDGHKKPAARLQDKRKAALSAADCAERVLPIFEAAYPNDDRPRKAIEAVRSGTSVAAARAAAFAAHAAARAAADAPAAYAARAAAHAAATIHVADHAPHAAAYAARAAALTASTRVSVDAENASPVRSVSQTEKLEIVGEGSGETTARPGDTSHAPRGRRTRSP